LTPGTKAFEKCIEEEKNQLMYEEPYLQWGNKQAFATRYNRYKNTIVILWWENSSKFIGKADLIPDEKDKAVTYQSSSIPLTGEGNGELPPTVVNVDD
jgi:hypothetical protein